MKVKALGAFETLATTHPTTHCHILEGLNFQQHCHENLKSHKNTLFGLLTSTLVCRPLLLALTYIILVSFELNKIVY